MNEYSNIMIAERERTGNYGNYEQKGFDLWYHLYGQYMEDDEDDEDDEEDV